MQVPQREDGVWSVAALAYDVRTEDWEAVRLLVASEREQEWPAAEVVGQRLTFDTAQKLAALVEGERNSQCLSWVCTVLPDASLRDLPDTEAAAAQIAHHWRDGKLA